MILSLLELLEEALESLTELTDAAEVVEAEGVAVDVTSALTDASVQEILDSFGGEVSGEELQNAMDAADRVLGITVDASPEERAEQLAALNARNYRLGAMLQGQTASADISNSVGESMSKLAESKADSFRYGGLVKPFDTGLTLSDVSYPVDESGVTKLGHGLVERGGSVYKIQPNGTYHRVN